MNLIRHFLLLTAACLAGTVASCATPSAPDDGYARVAQERADKVMAKLDVPERAKADRVRNLIAQFYRDLNALQTERDARVAEAKVQSNENAEARDAASKAVRAEIDAKRDAMRRNFLQQLSSELSAAQTEQVKDALTYGVLPLTFRVYQEMLPQLTDEQRRQILLWLVEARDLAIAGFTSEEKHGFFGKYKGRINNYLAKAGYDMKEAEKAMRGRNKQ